ncbi:hypothetical protein O3M35_007383 [Rhynocoris fuscipes]|uniref:HORMA domain-containing protein n=1 Tax=Rhynocoris fuscipes TaxID=488301 RepID=A0AAW1DGN6_9HEMI
MNINRTINPSYIILEFLEVAIHNILYCRKLYPEGIFTLKKKYGVPIHVSMYPDLNYYISESLKAVEEVLMKNELKEMDIYIYDRLAKPIERFVFKINSLRQNIKEIGNDDPYFVKLKEMFRAFCLKLNLNNAYMKPLPEDANFKIVIHTNERASISLSDDPKFQVFPWIEAEKVDVIIETPKLIPIKTIEHDTFNLLIYSE